MPLRAGIAELVGEIVAVKPVCLVLSRKLIASAMVSLLVRPENRIQTGQHVALLLYGTAQSLLDHYNYACGR